MLRGPRPELAELAATALPRTGGGGGGKALPWIIIRLRVGGLGLMLGCFLGDVTDLC